MSNEAIEQHIQLNTGKAVLIAGDPQKTEHISTVLNVTINSATSFCSHAQLGKFKNLAGFDSRGSFLIQHNPTKSDFIKVKNSVGWTAKSDSFTPKELDPVNQFFASIGKTNSVNDKDLILMLSRRGLLEHMSQEPSFQFIAARHSSGIWQNPCHRPLLSDQKQTAHLFYGLARILYSQNLPASRLILEASSGCLVGWRSPNKTCGFGLWEYSSNNDPVFPFTYIDAFARIFAT